jgi:hypothetical protein
MRGISCAPPTRVGGTQDFLAGDLPGLPRKHLSEMDLLLSPRGARVAGLLLGLASVVRQPGHHKGRLMPIQRRGILSVAGHSGRTGTFGRLLGAAALAALLVALGPATAEAGTLCIIALGSSTDVGNYAGTGSCGSPVDYSPGAERSHTWEFYNGQGGPLVYTLKIAGTPMSEFSLDVSSVLTGVFELPSAAGAVATSCVPTLDSTYCGLFDVLALTKDADGDLVPGNATWAEGYWMTITWLASEGSAGRPDSATILQAEHLEGGGLGPYSPSLTDIRYDLAPNPSNPADPAIGGKGDNFSRFGVFTPGVLPVPDPGSTLLLLGTSLAGVLAFARRFKR